MIVITYPRQGMMDAFQICNSDNNFIWPCELVKKMFYCFAKDVFNSKKYKHNMFNKFHPAHITSVIIRSWIDFGPGLRINLNCCQHLVCVCALGMLRKAKLHRQGVINDKMLEITSDAPANAGKHVTSNTACEVFWLAQMCYDFK